MSLSRLGDYLDQMLTAASDARRFVDGMSKEAAARIMDKHSEFIAGNPEIPWRGMRGMRNRVAHGYFDVNLDVVWDTAQTALPDLLLRLERFCG